MIRFLPPGVEMRMSQLHLRYRFVSLGKRSGNRCWCRTSCITSARCRAGCQKASRRDESRTFMWTACGTRESADRGLVPHPRPVHLFVYLSPEVMSVIQVERHAAFMRSFLRMLPSSTSSLDTSRLTIVFFAVSGLDLLSVSHIPSKERRCIIDWIYRQQISSSSEIGRSGFRGSPANGCDHAYDFGHLAMSYSALASLIVLGDDLSRVDRVQLLKGLRELQLPTGSFAAAYGSESDMRFVYCAVVICHLLDDWSAIDVDKSVEFIRESRTYEGAFGQGPGHEAHGGSTFCAVASLILMGKLDQVLDAKQVEHLKRWCLFKQVGGFQGRPNKDADTCYSFWVGATLKLLSSHHLVNKREDMDFVKSTEDCGQGGLAKFPNNFPDVLHTFLGLSGLSLHGDAEQAVDPRINVSQRSLTKFREAAKTCE